MLRNEVNKTMQFERLMVGIYEVHCWDGLRWHDMQTKFGVWKAPSAVREQNVVMGPVGLGTKNHSADEGQQLSSQSVKHVKFYDGRFRCSRNIKVITLTVWEAAMLVLFVGGIYEVCSSDVLGFIKISSGVQKLVEGCTYRHIGTHIHNEIIP
jgi:hypothetical protein